MRFPWIVPDEDSSESNGSYTHWFGSPRFRWRTGRRAPGVLPLLVALLPLAALLPLTACGRGGGAAREIPGPDTAVGDPARTARTGRSAAAGAPGDLLTHSVIDGAPAGVRAWRITYLSRPAGQATAAVSGIVLAPDARVPVPTGGRKVVSFAHGTTGIADSCAPSRARPVLGPALWTIPLVQAGYVVALTDYAGLGTPGDHAIYVASPEGRAVLDAARAARTLRATGAGDEVVAWGYSQGGQAALAAGAQAAVYAPDLRIRGVVATAPLADLTASLATLRRNPDGVGYLLLATAGLAASDPRIDLDRYLTPTGRRLLGIARTRCAADLLGASIGTSTGTAFTVDPLAQAPFAPGFARQEAEVTRFMAPTLLLQGDLDAVIRRPVSDGVVRRLCGQGTPVDYRRYPLADHGSILGASMPDLMTWVAQRFAPRPPMVTDICALSTDARK
ncbi:Secretory lipase [Frankia canadensis]|uniref:Secretory lipase n=1 Tax=Frankia canadensis TaxID=1836972 RepID=A0A2I2L0F2_9ACTN|nr:lipase family protein [Frankia canadensis]SNQ51403.1 Secretory lipase [Frankia canadensis]SOU58693.1 Secretory lipase [Frankia canadensis]